MKKVLVIGAGGTIGLCLLKFLLAEGKYEITAVDLKNNKSIKKLKKYRNRINVIYSDCLDRSLIDNLIKDHDYVYNLATCLPPLAEYKKGLCDIIETNVTENIIKAINYYNPNCHLIYGSSTSVYGSDNINNEINIDSMNQLHPFYLVYIKEDGEILSNHLNVKNTLDLLKIMSKGKNEPIKEAYNIFNEFTNDGKDMNLYSDLLSKCIDSIITLKEENDIDSLFRRGGTTMLNNKIKGLDDFELISFMVII